MKRLLLLALLSTFAMSEVKNISSLEMAQKAEDKRLCKVFIKKAQTYEATMRSDDFAIATLESYKKRIVLHCNSIIIKS